MSRSILVLGASGFLGSNLSHYLENLGERVIRASRVKTARTEFKLSSYQPDEIRRLVDSAQPKTILNCVGVVGHASVERNPEDAHVANVVLPGNLARIAMERDMRLVHFSSDSVYSGKPDDAPFSENSLSAPFSLYGKQKLESEHQVLSQNPHSLVLRVNFFGWSLSGKIGMLDYFVSRASSGRLAIGYDKYSVTSIHTKDLARIVSLSVNREIIGTYNLGSADTLTKFKFGQNVYRLLGASPENLVPGNPSIWEEEGIKERNLSMISKNLETVLSIRMPRQVDGISQSFIELPEFIHKYGDANRVYSFRSQGGQED